MRLQCHACALQTLASVTGVTKWKAGSALIAAALPEEQI
jgi:hypothetical protein